MEFKGARPLMLLALLLTPAVPAPVPLAGAADPKAFLLGVLRRDGIVSPIAVFDGKYWTSPWPASLRYKEVPMTLDAVPGKWWGAGGAPAQMTIWVDGSRRGA